MKWQEVEAELSARLAQLEKRLQHAVKSLHIALNDRYTDLMDRMGCPWVQSKLPASLACHDLNKWWVGVYDSITNVRIPVRIRLAMGLPAVDFEPGCRDDEEERPIVEPQELKRKIQIREEEVDESDLGQRPAPDDPVGYPVPEYGFSRLMHMSVVLGCKVSLLITRS